MNTLSIQTLTHVPFEGLGCIEEWISANNHSVSFTKLYEEYTLPAIDTFDWLIIMGGPMGVYDEAIHPWLTDEKAFIKQAIDAGKTIIGICLGSQLIAEILNARVYPNKQKEIGWYDLKMSTDGKDEPILTDFEETFPVFHWHGDTYDLPVGSIRLFSSEICLNQAFLYNKNVLGLQFHFEVTEESMAEMVKHGAQELIENDTIQSAHQILSQTDHIAANNQKMFKILDYLQNQ
jgi:GMP synthase-like glutamine amidotransferase